MNNLIELFAKPIHLHTATDALADGTLVDAGDLARDLFTWPVLLTAAAWADSVAWTDRDSDTTGAHGQSETGRLWDVLWMTRHAIQNRPRIGTDHVDVVLYRIHTAPNGAPSDAHGCPSREGHREPAPEKVTLKAVIGALDDGSPVLVISLPDED